ncbi:MAG: CHC2 zinc finger domain-containing protein [Candidatus Acidiferrum sp.]
MARIPEGEIAKLKREVSLERLVEAHGVKLKRRGADLVGLCPFHEDRSPSLIISPQKNLWNCLGACGKGGSVIDWVMRAEGISFRHAFELLKQEYLPLAAKSGPPPKKSTTVKLPPLAEHTIDDKRLLEAVVTHYHETLKRTPEAQQYLAKRGLQSAEMVEQFRLGFANRTLGYHLPASNRSAGAEQRERLKQIGILRQESGHEHFNGSLVIPIFNLEGEVAGMYGRKITRDTALREGTEVHSYLRGPHRGVWNEQALIASKEIILCEALIDALTFWCAGFRHVTASYGVNGFTDDHRGAFRKHGTKRIFIGYDRDDAGERAAEKLAEELLAMRIECFRVQFPKGMDANDYALKVTPAAKSLGVLLNNAIWLGKGQQPTVAVTEPQISEGKSAAKEKISETMEANTKEENDLPLAVESEQQLESAPVATMPAMPPSPLEVPIEINGDEIKITQGDRRYRVLGLEKNTTVGILRVNLLVTRGERLHVDTFDLYQARHRAIYSKQASEELRVKEEVVSRDLGKVLWKLEELQRQLIQKTLEPKEEEITLSAEEKAAALELLRDPKLLERVLSDFERCGVVGEETNKRVSYLAAVSRLLAKPLAIVVQSSSSAGKSSLMEAVLDFMPEEQREEYSAMTGQALFYMGQKNLKHKILAVSEEQGATRAAYALKLLQSEGVLKIASTGKDPASGKLVTHEYLVEGPVMIFLTTTAQEIDEELINRSIVLMVNEDRAQTQAIHKKQREAQTIEGLWARRQRTTLVKLHRNAQRLLRPIEVVNNHVHDEPDFPDYMTRTRRDHMKFLTLVNAIALLHQYQRPVKTDTRNGETLEYIEATKEDVKLARELVRQVLGPSLDELPAQTRRLLLLVAEMVKQESERMQMECAEYRFTRRTVRQYTRWGDTQLRVHLRRLEEMEYLLVRRGGQGLSYEYQLRFEENYAYDANFAGVNGHFAGGARVVRGAVESEESSAMMRGNEKTSRTSENTYRGSEEENRIVAVPSIAAKPNGAAAAGAK